MHRRRTSWRRSTGATLIEVLAALALLGSLAVAMVLSRSRLVEQHARAQQKAEAVRVADDLLAGWWAGDPAAFPVGEEGPVDGHPSWRWETHAIEHQNLRPFNAGVVRLRVLDHSASAGSGTSGGGPVELTAVDVVLPNAAGAAAPREGVAP